MIDYATYQRIQHLHHVEKLTVTQIAHAMPMDARTVRRWLDEPQFRARATPARPSKLDPYKGYIRRLLEHHPYSAAQLITRLREAGYDGGVTIVKDYVQRVRPVRAPAFLTLHFAPGECAQVDWGHYASVNVGNIYRGQRVASHVRSELKGRHTTADEHMPEKHRRMGRWTPERFTRWAENIGPNTGALITTVLGSRRHPQQAFRSCLGILRLAKSYGDARLEAAARRALAIGANSYRSIESILNHRLDEHPPEPIEPAAPIEHHNIRGSDYYS